MNTLQTQSVTVEPKGSASFRYLDVTLQSGGVFYTEPGAMASSSAKVGFESQINGNLFQALAAYFFGDESFFISRYCNTASSPQKITLTQRTPGEILVHELRGDTVFIQPGAFVGYIGDIKRNIEWAGLASWIAKEGLFKIALEGTGTVFYGSYGAVVEQELNGELIVDSGHLLSYPPSVRLKIGLAGGLFASIFGGEGFVLRLRGSGKIKLQTRSISGLASWINPRFW